MITTILIVGGALVAAYGWRAGWFDRSNQTPGLDALLEAKLLEQQQAKRDQAKIRALLARAAEELTPPDEAAK